MLWTGILNDSIVELEWPKRKPWPELSTLIEASWRMQPGNLLDMFSIVTLHLGGGMQPSLRRGRKAAVEPISAINNSKYKASIATALVGTAATLDLRE